MKHYMKVICGLVIACALFLVGCGGETGASSQSQSGGSSTIAQTKTVEGDLTIKMLDIGQGDAILIQTGHKNILVDTGDNKTREEGKKAVDNNRLFEELAEAGIDHIDTLMMSHAHADHIGLGEEVVNRYQVGEFIYNGIPSTNKAFTNTLKALKAVGGKQVKVKAGDTLDFGNGISFEVLSPDKALIDEDTAAIKAKEDVEANNESIVGRLTYGNFSMLFTGDAEKEIEAVLVEKYTDKLKSDVLKAGHHGSKTSSTRQFLATVDPSDILISVGANNQYGHPSNFYLEASNRTNDRKYAKSEQEMFAIVDEIPKYRTDLNGTITIKSDGRSYSISTEK